MATKKSLNVVGIIPARYGSQRFPGKPLAKILGKTLIQRTYENAKRCSSLDEIVVATDDERIYQHVQEFGGQVVMTSSACPTGTDRLVEVIKTDKHLQKASVVVNIQGDEPCLEPEVISHIIKLLEEDPQADMSTAIMRLTSGEEALNPSIIKCVIDQKGYALYFSRSLIPGGKERGFRSDVVYYKHLGIYGYRRDFLLNYAKLSPTPLQQAEDLEQLKVLEHGYQIKTALVKSASIGVDNPEDIKKVEQLLCK
jgi:3-deoxy-manno-octulosonate cytidylyltransferase (CMP-KDO synthetase)